MSSDLRLAFLACGTAAGRAAPTCPADLSRGSLAKAEARRAKAGAS